jgi:hypothetical protein
VRFPEVDDRLPGRVIIGRAGGGGDEDFALRTDVEIGPVERDVFAGRTLEEPTGGKGRIEVAAVHQPTGLQRLKPVLHGLLHLELATCNPK